MSTVSRVIRVAIMSTVSRVIIVAIMSTVSRVIRVAIMSTVSRVIRVAMSTVSSVYWQVYKYSIMRFNLVLFSYNFLCVRQPSAKSYFRKQY